MDSLSNYAMEKPLTQEQEWQMLIKLAWNTMTEDEFFKTFGEDAKAFFDFIKSKQKEIKHQNINIEQDIPY